MYSFEEFTPGIVGIAAIVLGQPGRPLGTLHIAMPAVRCNPEVLERAGQVLQRTAKTMAQQIEQAGLVSEPASESCKVLRKSVR